MVVEAYQEGLPHLCASFYQSLFSELEKSVFYKLCELCQILTIRGNNAKRTYASIAHPSELKGCMMKTQWHSSKL